jgi:hypothetical protein
LSSRVRWAKHRMAFWMGGASHELSSPLGLLGFPLPKRTRLGLVGLGLRVLMEPSSERLHGLDAASWLRGMGGTPGARAFLDRVVQLRFGHTTDQLSAAYLRRRVSTRELSAVLGTIPGQDWTHLLVQACRAELLARGVRILSSTAAAGLEQQGARVVAVRTADGQRLPARAVVSTVHPEAFLDFAPQLGGDAFARIQSSSLHSLVVAVRPPVPTRAYWTNVLEPAGSACVVFQLDRLNPGLAPAGLRLLNFVTHGIARRDRGWWERTPQQVLEASLDALQAATGSRPEPVWFQLTKLPFYTPLYVPGFRVPPARSPHVDNLYFAGNYTTFPEVATTGMAMRSGQRAAAALCAEQA